MAASKAQLKANKRWKHRNRIKNRRNNYKSACKNYILHWATDKELANTIPKWIEIRKNELK